MKAKVKAEMSKMKAKVREDEGKGEGEDEGKGEEDDYDDDDFETYDGCPEGTTEHPDGKTRSDGSPVCLSPEDLQRLTR